MNLEQILTLDCTVCSAVGKSKKNILEQISAIAASKISNTSEKELLMSLMAREKLSSTGIGKGIAIPHGRLTNTNAVVAVLITTDKPIVFDAIDDKPVDIFFAIFVPADNCQQHIETLANIAKVFSDKETCKKVRKCQTSQQLYNAVIHP
ncbi:PTS IIA-like nitrogen regulatory protein PtsN [Thalassomonas sp. M1454]|uniref:PTS IIA-like nitrogen regulatory protein PtsN n=1 Tax=Thalassomonas sp. M1454 TaxID=2594477 RepID=UPI00117E14C3|nr:PTS IIA-like nitrogen regulatory protein PtsN [Thalassomonas sp. M1454]TRX52785.1 PTS IIA-like nitrogen regulatory protein PtsN [Thalassomonas sp. M1454]